MAAGIKTGGRKKGTPNKRTLVVAKRDKEILDKAAATGQTPLEVMLENMRHFQKVALDAEAILAGMSIAELGAADLPPDQQFKLLLAEVKKAAGLRQMAHECARDAAPYAHARLNSIEAKITHRDEMTENELRRSIAADLAAAGIESPAFTDTDGETEAGETGRLN